jgi:hypothetical protein
MKDVVVPQFGELLAEHLQGVPPEAYPYLLSELERTAADRYRGWAEQVPEHREVLRACAAAEDEIADRVAALFPPTDAHRALVGEIVPRAKAVYYAAFDGFTAREQLCIQAAAERQGAEAWQRLKAAHPEHGDALDALSVLERGSADRVDALLAEG